jgi:AcrR family transcriptional regulator
MARKKGREMDTRGALLTAAWDLFRERGYEATSVDAIVRRAGLSKGTFFHYFASKLELLEAVSAQVVETAFAQAAPTIARAGGAAARLNRLLGVMRDWRLAHIGVLMDVWRALALEENALLRLKLAALANARVLPLLVEIVRQGNAEKVFSVADVKGTAGFVLAVLDAAGAANLRLAAEVGAPGRVDLAESMRRRSTSVLGAIERLLAARPGTLRRPSAAALRSKLAASRRR